MTALRRLALAFLLLTGALPALAFTEAPQDAQYAIPLPEYTASRASYARDLGVQRTVRTLESRYGGPWTVYAWNDANGTPRQVYGNGPQVASRVGDAAALERLARQVVADNAALLGAEGVTLRLDRAPHALGKWVAHFQQTWQGLDVWRARARVAVSDSGRLLLLGSELFDRIDLDPTPALSAAEARAIATAALPFDPAVDRVTAAPELLVLPLPISDSAVEQHLVWRLSVRTHAPLGEWVTHVDAHDGTILWRYNDIHFAYGGDAVGDTQVYGWCDGVATLPESYLRVSVSGAGTAITDVDGNWTVDGSGGPRDVSADFFGPYVEVANFNGADALFTGTAAEDLPFTVDFDDTNSRQDERDTFDAVNEIHDFFAQFDPGFAYSNTRIQAIVNRDDGYCPGNAWWDGAINFCGAAGGYANTGELQQVIHHEFGHGVQASILGYQGDEGLGEGNGDILGNLITQDPVIGRGFYTGNCSSGIRDSDNTLQYPDDVIGQEIHAAGRVIAGFNWDAMQNLQAEVGGGASWDAPGTVLSAERWHFGRILLEPSTQPDQVFATFFADDDNGDLDDGTPHYDSFCAAAESHGFDCPPRLIGVLFSHVPVGDNTDDANPYAIAADVISTYAPIVPASVELHWRVDGGSWNASTLTHDGGDSYSGAIPAQATGSQVDYYLSAADELGSTGSDPEDAPAEFHSFLIAWLIDPVEVANGWTVDPDGTDGAAASSAWALVDPVGGGGSPEDDHTPDGTLCWTTGLDNDVDFGRTTLESPVYDLAGATSAELRYWKWFSSDSGNDEFDLWLSNDGGDTWTRVEHDPASSGGWVNVIHDLADSFAAPDQLRLKFTAEDFGAMNTIEAAVDDIAILASFDDLTAADGGLDLHFAAALEQNRPNPFNPSTEIRFSLPAAGRARLSVYDARGRLLRTLLDGELPAGPARVTWDGRDQSGRTAASGVYLYRLDTSSGSFSRRMLLLK